MSDPYDDPGHAGDAGGGNGGSDRDPPGASGPTGWTRGVGVVAVAVVIGALLMPSATRAPLNVTTASQFTPTSTAPTTTVPKAAPTTTQATIVAGASLIHVTVANGTTVPNLAGSTSAYLRTRGFTTLPARDATTKVPASLVYAAATEQSAASTVADALGLPASAIQAPSAVPPVSTTGGATVVVIAGPDLARLASAGSPTSSTGASTH
jgi:LytR cell envelope-related transcriptional attenuator